MASAWIPQADIKKVDIMVVAGGCTGREMHTTFKSNRYYLTVANLGVYDQLTKTNIVRMEDENVKSGYLFSDVGMGISGDKDIIWCTYEMAYKSHIIRDFTSFSPVLINNRKPVTDWGNKESAYVEGLHKRTCLAWNNQFFVVLATDGRMRLKDARGWLMRWGMWYAGNCDGGGSQFLINKDVLMVDSGRKNASWLLIYSTRG